MKYYYMKQISLIELKDLIDKSIEKHGKDKKN